MSEKERQKYEELIRLIKENPDLPVVPLVDAEIVCDDGGYWLGGWGHAAVDEYLLPPNEEPMLFKSDDDVFDTLEKYLGYNEFEKLPESEEECRPFYEALPWKKAIVVYINLPDVVYEPEE